MDQFILILGLVAVTQGLPYALSPKTARKRIKKWLNQDDLTFRTYGAIVFGIGVGIIYLGLF